MHQGQYAFLITYKNCPRVKSCGAKNLDLSISFKSLFDLFLQ